MRERESGPAAMRGLRGMRGMRGMRGGRGGPPPYNSGPPRREYGNRNERNFEEESPQIIERTEGERGGRGGGGPMRGRGRGDFSGGHHLRSRDDFYVAPPRYYNGDNFKERGYYD